MKPIDRRFVFVFFVVVCVLAAQLPTRRASLAANAPATKPVKLETGLIVSFAKSTPGEPIDAEPSRLAALYVPDGFPASPFLPPGPFTATWTGVINSRIKDEKLFAAEGRGALRVLLNDAVVLDLHGDLAGQSSAPVKLKKGRNPLVMTYTAPADGDASVRLLWADKDKPFDPVPPTVFAHDPSDEALTSHAAIRAGREIVATMRCVNCHKSDATATGGMPELHQDAPNLVDVAKSLRPEWIAYWITNPKSLRPGATMPRVFHEKPASDPPTVDARAWDVAVYLNPAIGAAEQKSNTDPVVVANGTRLFTSLGCIACHIAPGIEDTDPTLSRIPLKFIKAKFKPDALVAFLRKPEDHYAWIRMPDFRLSDDEANALAGFLQTSAKKDALPPITLAPGDPARGKALFESAGCLNCHATEAGGSQRPPTATDLSKADWSRGCAASDAGRVGLGVDFAFTPQQQAALRAFEAAGLSSLKSDPLPDFAARQITGLRCNACHSIDDHDSVWSNLDDEISKIEQDLPSAEGDSQHAAVDQSRPPLTWVGEKLHVDWMAKFIAGEITYKPRQWLTSRMPGFRIRAKPLAEGLGLSHGRAATEAAEPPIDAKLADVGRGLVSRSGFGCVACHGVGDQAALAPFEAPSINFGHITDRMRHDFFSRWIRHPQYYLPGTKMPQFSDANGKTAYKNIFGGDAPPQYEAIWQYLRAGDQIVPPP